MTKTLFRATLASASAAGLALLAPTSATAATTTLVDETISQPIGGAEICAVEKCLPELEGVKNVHLKATYTGSGVTEPTLTQVSAPGCTANVNVAYRLTTGSAGPGVVTVLVEFDRTDKNGNVIPGSHHSLTAKVAVPGTTSKTVDPLVSVCGTALN